MSTGLYFGVLISLQVAEEALAMTPLFSGTFAKEVHRCRKVVLLLPITCPGMSSVGLPISTSGLLLPCRCIDLGGALFPPPLQVVHWLAHATSPTMEVASEVQQQVQLQAEEV